MPNSTILGTEVVNYSSLAHSERGLILHTTVGIGYETPWRQVEAMLIEAAATHAGLAGASRRRSFSRPALGDFCVTYEINVYCDTPHLMRQLYADLHRNILDVFNEYGVQIMTPAYEGDPEQPKLVPKADWYTAPAHPPGTGMARGRRSDARVAGRVPTKAWASQMPARYCRARPQRTARKFCSAGRERPPGGHRADLGHAVEHGFGFA